MLGLRMYTSTLDWSLKLHPFNGHADPCFASIWRLPEPLHSLLVLDLNSAKTGFPTLDFLPRNQLCQPAETWVCVLLYCIRVHPG